MRELGARIKGFVMAVVTGVAMLVLGAVAAFVLLPAAVDNSSEIATEGASAVNWTVDAGGQLIDAGKTFVNGIQMPE